MESEGLKKKLTGHRVADLKAELRKFGLAITGTKEILIDRLVQHHLNTGVEEQDDIETELEKELNLSGHSESGSGVSDLTKKDGEAETEKDLEKTKEEDSDGDMKIDEQPLVVETKDKELMEAEDEDNEETIKIAGHSKLFETSYEEEEEEEGSEKLPGKDEETKVTLSGKASVVEAETSMDQSKDEEDNDALNLTIGEEEDFMDTEDVERGDRHARGAEEVEVIDVDLGKGMKGDVVDLDLISEGSSVSKADSTAENHKEKKSEGKVHGKSKDEDRVTLLITGLSVQTTATEIRAVFKKHGKIGGVKIMSNAMDPEGSRFALVAVMSTEDANHCIKHLDGFELHGRIIHVDKAKDDILSADWLKKESQSKRETGRISNGGGGQLETEKTNREGGLAGAAEKSSHADASTSAAKTEKRRSTGQKENAGDGATSTRSKSDSRSETSKKDQEKKSTSKSTSKGSHEPVRRPSGSSSSAQKHTSSERRKSNEKVEDKRKFSRIPSRPSPRVFYDTETRRTPPRSFPSRGRYFRGGSGRQEFHHRRPPGRPEVSLRVRRSRSPTDRPSYRRGSMDSRRGGRQPELTFEDIYVTRQREKEREVERERREMERRRAQEAEKQRSLDEEFRRLAKEREKIEIEKAELKRQKEKMIMEEREKQRIEHAEIEREKALLARNMKAKRLHAESSRDRGEAKKYMDDRDRSRRAGAGSFIESSFRSSTGINEKERSHSHPYRREEKHSIGLSLSSVSSRETSRSLQAPRARSPPSWGHSGRQRETDRHRERDHMKVREDRRDDKKSFLDSLSSEGGLPKYMYSSQYVLGQPSGRLSSTSKSMPVGTPYTGSSRGLAPSAYGSGASATGVLRSAEPSWLSGEGSWEPEDRATRPTSDLSDRWASNATSTLSSSLASRLSTMPLAPPPPLFSNTREGLGLGSSNSSYPSGLYASTNYTYKMPPIPSHRR